MSTLTVRNVSDRTKRRLRLRAAENGRSMEAEVRAILDATFADAPEEENLAQAIRRAVEAVGGVDLELPPREPPREPPDFTR